MKQLKAAKPDLFHPANARLKATGASRTGIAVSRKCKTDNWTPHHFFLGRSENRSVPVHPRTKLIGFDRMTENQIGALHWKWKCSASDQSDKNWLIWSKLFGEKSRLSLFYVVTAFVLYPPISRRAASFVYLALWDFRKVIENGCPTSASNSRYLEPGEWTARPLWSRTLFNMLLCYFKGKSIVLHLLKGAELKTHNREDREEKKAQHPMGFEPTTSL